MAIDPMLYQKLSGRSGDPMSRMGEALAKDVKAKHARDEMPKGLAGGLGVNRKPGIWANIFWWFKDKTRPK